MIKRFAILLAILFGVGGLIGCAGTSSNIQSAPVTYNQDRANQKEDVPVIRANVTVLFREVPSDGATKSFMSGLVKALEGITPAGVVASLGTSPERAFSELERGRRGQVSIPIAIDNPKGKNTSLTISTNDIRESAQEALDGAEVPGVVQGVFVKGVKIEIKSTTNDLESNNEGENNE